MWSILRTRPNDYEDKVGLAVVDMTVMIGKVANLVEGAVQQWDEAKAALRVFANDIDQRIPDIARSIGRSEATNAIPELLVGLREQIDRWWNF